MTALEAGRRQEVEGGGLRDVPDGTGNDDELWGTWLSLD